jgi:phage-related protein
VKQGVADVAIQFGLAGRQVAEFARQSETIAVIHKAFSVTAGSLGILRTALNPVLTGFRDLTQVGLSFLPGIAKSLAAVGVRFGEWLQKIVASGKAAEWISNALATLKQLGGILSNVGGILKSVFSAASASGSGFLGVIGQAVRQLNLFLKTAQGQTALKSIFTGLATIGSSLAPVIGALVIGLGTLAKPVGQLAQLIGPILTTAITALAPALASLAPGLKALFDGLGQAVTLIAPALKPLGVAIGQIGVAIGPILPVVADLVSQLVSGLAPILGGLFVALGPLVLALVQLAGAFTPLIPPLAQIIVQLVSGLVPALTPLIGILAQIAGVVGQFLVSALGMLASAIVPLLPQLSQMAQTVGNQLLIVLVALSPALLQVLQALLPLLPQLLATIPPFVQLVVAITPLLVLLIRLSAVVLRTLLPPIVSAIGIFLSFGNAQTAAIRATSGLIGMITRLPGQIVGALKSAGSWLYNTGRNVVVGLWNGIASLGSWLSSRVWSWVKSVLPTAVKWALGIHSPSKVMAKLGRYAGMGLAVGIDASRTGVSRAATRLAGAAIPAIGNNGLTVTASAAGGGSAGFNPAGFADAVAAGIQRAGIAVHMDSQPVGQIISRQQGRLTDQRRRTG